MSDNKTNINEIKLGDLLRQHRKDQNKEISAISSYLKIKASDVEAIEEENWNAVTRHLYKPGLIRSYAKMLHIDNKIIEQKIKELPFESNIKNIKHRLVNIGEEIEITPSRDMFFNFLLISILLFLVLLTIYNASEKKTRLLTNQDLIDEITNASGVSINDNSDNLLETEDSAEDEKIIKEQAAKQAEEKAKEEITQGEETKN